VIKYLALTALVAGSVATLGLAGSSAAGASTPTCSSVQLQPHYERTDGTAGTFFDVWQLVNAGGTCQLDGYVTFRNFESDGRPLGSSITPTGTPSLVTLAHGQHASFAFGRQDPSITQCTPEAATNMILWVPGGQTSAPLLAGRGEKACGGQVKATPVKFGG
jgi:hypothetical protein